MSATRKNTKTAAANDQKTKTIGQHDELCRCGGAGAWGGGGGEAIADPRRRPAETGPGRQEQERRHATRQRREEEAESRSTSARKGSRKVERGRMDVGLHMPLSMTSGCRSFDQLTACNDERSETVKHSELFRRHQCPLHYWAHSHSIIIHMNHLITPP